MKTKPQLASIGVIRYLWIVLGIIAFLLGTVGIFLPLLPTVPFYLLTVFCLAKGSERLHRKFLEHKLYAMYVEPFKHKRGMSMAVKLRIMITVTILMAVGFYMMSFTWGRMIMSVVWLGHIYFLFIKTKTIKD